MATVVQLQAQVTALTKQVQVLQASQTQLESSIKTLNAQTTELQKTIDIANAKLASGTLTPAQTLAIQDTLEKTKAQYSLLKQQEVAEQQKYQQQQSQIQNLREQINGLNQQIAALQGGAQETASTVSTTTAVEAAAIAAAAAGATALYAQVKEYGTSYAPTPLINVPGGDTILDYNPQSLGQVVDNVQQSLSNIAESGSAAFSSVFSGTGLLGGAASRLRASGMVAGAEMGPPAPPVASLNGKVVDEMRVRIALPIGSPQIFYKDSNSITAALLDTDGLIFPYTPQVTIAHEARYETLHPTHSNFQFHFYQNSAIRAINLSGEFVARTQAEGRYAMAGILFLQGLTKMFNINDKGGAIPLGGTPPMVARLHGYKLGGFDSLPVVVTEVQTIYPDDVDYITILARTPAGQDIVYKLPTTFTIQVGMLPLFSREFASKDFGVFDYMSGKRRLMGDG